jgi:hypothetical protein
MIKWSIVFFASLMFIAEISVAQKNGILPLTGIRYFKAGLWAKNIDVNVDGSNLLSDRVPLNKEIEIKLQVPSGFTAVSGTYFVGAEVNMFTGKGAVLSKTPNVFSNNSTTGFPAAAFKEVIVKVGLRPEIIKQEGTVLIQVRFFDLKSSNQLRLEFPVTIARGGEAVQVSKVAQFVKTSDASTAVANVLTMKSIDIIVDTSIRVNPKMSYISLDIPGIEGTSMDDILSGTETFWVYDQNLNTVKTGDKLLKKVGGSMETSIVNYTLKIPFKLKSNTSTGYITRFRWESKDRKKIFDVVVVK